jgi:hypothetical protein
MDGDVDYWMVRIALRWRDFPHIDEPKLETLGDVWVGFTDWVGG